MTDQTAPAPTGSRWTPGSVVLNAARGGLIGLAELVPGVSGGTVALVTGVYERALASADTLLESAKLAFTDRKAAGRALRRVDFSLLIPLIIGMGILVVLMASTMQTFVEDHIVLSRGLFFGMIVASIAVPLLMIPGADLRRKFAPAALLFVLAAIATFFATGFTGSDNSDPNLLLVFIAAAIAVCALVLPGVSGSFFLYAIGIYGATLGAVSDRNLVYLGVFFLGMLTGLVLFVRFLRILLTRYRTLTLATMAGLLLGSLRALWPWQNENNSLLAPGEQVLPAALLAIVGAAIVIMLIVIERRFSAKAPAEQASRVD